MAAALWHELIENARSSGSTILDLGNCSLTEMPDMLFEDEAFCKQLTSLSFGSHFMRHNDSDAACSNTWSPNSISVIDPRLALCTSLTELSLHKNAITKIEHLDKLVNLTILDLGSNEISVIEELDTLTNLEVLRLSNNNIEKAAGLDKLTKLISLYLGWNKLTSLDGIEALRSLELLYIGVNNNSGTAIASLEEIKNLEKLRVLYADANQISDCTPLSELRALEFINLNNNQITDIEPLLPLIKKGLRVGNPKFEGQIKVDRNPLNNPPLEIVYSGNDAILRYFSEAALHDSVEINEAKLLILGAGGVGKTTLAKKLKDPAAPLPDPNDTTVGINININYVPVKFNDREYRIHVWDFGGQDIYHATHQFFLTRRSLYILMQDGREQKTTLNYWLQAQELLAEESPVILLQNLKAGGARKDLDAATLRSNFKNLQDYQEANLANGNEIPKVWNSIKARLMTMTHFGDRLPQKWVSIRSEIETLAINQQHISLNQYRDLCVKNEVTDTSTQNTLLQYLHDLGVVLNFKDIQELKRLVVIKPSWATNAVYKILDHTKKQNTQGHFTWADLEQVWDVPEYDNMFSQLLALMQKFELCYALSNIENTFIAPLLLPESKPDFEWNNSENLRLNYQYDFMPEGIVPRLIVRLHSILKNQQQVWKHGGIFEWNKTYALVTDDYISRKIEIRSKGDDPKGLLAIISKELDEINSKFYFTEKRNVRKMVPCICTKCAKSETPYFHKYEVLQKWLVEHKKLTKACDESAEEVDIQQLLNNVSLVQVNNNIAEGPGATQTEKKVLLVFANPAGTQALNLNAEYVKIKEAMDLAKPLPLLTFSLIDELYAKRSDMTKALAENPAVVHFSGHGDGDDGIIINDDDGTAHFVANDHLLDLFNSKKGMLECAVFSACKSEVQAEILSKTGIYVVGTKDKIDSKITVHFSQGFYQSFFGGNSYEAAFESGLYDARGYNRFEAEKFVLYKDGVRIK
jgi:internalin A